MADNEQTLVDKALRVAIPVGVDALAAATGMPAPVRLVAAPLVNAGIIAYDAPEGEKLTRALVEGGGSFAGGLLGRAAHSGVRPLLEPAAIAEINRAVAQSTMPGRAALLAYSPLGRDLMDITGSALGRAAGKAVADRMLENDAREAGRAKAAADLGLEKTAFLGGLLGRAAGAIGSKLLRPMGGAITRGASGVFSRLSNLVGRGAAAEGALGRGAANAARTPAWAGNVGNAASRAETAAVNPGVYKPPVGHVPNRVGGPSPFSTADTVVTPNPFSTADTVVTPNPFSTAGTVVTPNPINAAAGAPRALPAYGGTAGRAPPTSAALAPRPPTTITVQPRGVPDIVDAEYTVINPRSAGGDAANKALGLSHYWQKNKLNMAFGAAPGVLEFTQSGDPRALVSGAIGGAAGLRFGLGGSFLAPMVADRVIGRRAPEAPPAPPAAGTPGVY